MASKTMLRICHLLNQCDGCPKSKREEYWSAKAREEACGGCLYFEEIKELRPFIDTGMPDAAKAILAKGEDMTVNEIFFLMDQGVKGAIIQKSLGMTKPTFYRFLNNLEASRKKEAVG